MIAALAFVCMVWGSTWLAIKVNIQDQPPLGAAALRFLMAATLIAVTAGRRRLPREENPSLLYWSVLGTVMIGIPYSCVYWGEQYIPSGLAAVFFATYPLIVAFLAHRSAVEERVRLPLLAGVGCGMTGIAVLFSGDLAAFHPRFMFGGLLILVSAISAAVSTVMIKRRLAHLDPLLINLRPMLVGGVMLLVASLALERHREWRWTVPGTVSLIYLSVFGSVLAFAVYCWLMRTLPVARLSFVVYVTPLVALSLGAWLRSEPLTPRIAAGTAFILAAVLLARFSVAPERRCAGSSRVSE